MKYKHLRVKVSASPTLRYPHWWQLQHRRRLIWHDFDLPKQSYGSADSIEGARALGCASIAAFRAIDRTVKTFREYECGCRHDV